MNEKLTEILNYKYKNARESLIDNTLNYSTKMFKVNVLQIFISTIISNIITFYLGVK